MVKVNAIKTSVISLMSREQKNYETYKSVRLKNKVLLFKIKTVKM